ncbi:B-box zinc finger protein 22 [Primulina tabacum]|uniref:B-box zinc finger protein 22 n=1 Tax=Primulina tabacum TaxID=48773 RepID=UPI003F593132
MKIQCDSCEAAEANVLCCADKAVLCWKCGQKMHAANKLASKHQRVHIFSFLSQMPKCDICQETEGYFFCLEDRALLCRKCDVTIHTVNSLVSAHQRFLLTGIKVGLEATEPSPSSPWKTCSSEKISESEPRSISKQMALVPSNGLHNKSVPIQASLGDHFSSPELSFAGGVATGDVSQWPLGDFLGLGDINSNYNFADGGKLGDSDCSPAVRAADGILRGDECMDLVPDAFWAVPQIASPHTASGLYWPNDDQNPLDYAVSVPEICTSQMQNFYPHQHQGDVTSSKRKRQF